MCVDTMVAEGRRKRADRPCCCCWSTLAKRRVLYGNAVKAALRKHVEGKRVKSHGRVGRRICGQQKQQEEEAWRTERLPTGAMAPRNTTQYLMELAYSELLNTSSSSSSSTSSTSLQRLNDVKRSRSADVSQAHGDEDDDDDDEHVYSSLYSDEESMDFQQRDFENVVFLQEL